MSAQLTQRTYIWLFAAATALNKAILGVEQETQLKSFSPNQANIMMDAHLEADPAEGLRYQFFIRRASG